MLLQGISCNSRGKWFRKSTIASLILNNYKVTNGEISINNANIENISLDNIYGNIALVSTNSYIFNGTILDNLLMAKKDATEEDINNALKQQDYMIL